MGADLVSYGIVLPAKGTGYVVSREVFRIVKALDRLDVEVLIKDKDGFDKVAEALGISGGTYSNDMCEEDTAQLIELVKEDLKLAEGFSEKFGARDMGDLHVTIGGRKVIILYAGEMSWGDTPEGEGYQTLQALWRLGIADKLLEKVK
jgi:hypothetical protein